MNLHEDWEGDVKRASMPLWPYILIRPSLPQGGDNGKWRGYRATMVVHICIQQNLSETRYPRGVSWAARVFPRSAISFDSFMLARVPVPHLEAIAKILWVASNASREVEARTPWCNVTLGWICTDWRDPFGTAGCEKTKKLTVSILTSRRGVQHHRKIYIYTYIASPAYLCRALLLEKTQHLTTKVPLPLSISFSPQQIWRWCTLSANAAGMFGNDCAAVPQYDHLREMIVFYQYVFFVPHHFFPDVSCIFPHFCPQNDIFKLSMVQKLRFHEECVFRWWWWAYFRTKWGHASCTKTPKT